MPHLAVPVGTGEAGVEGYLLYLAAQLLSEPFSVSEGEHGYEWNLNIVCL